MASIRPPCTAATEDEKAVKLLIKHIDVSGDKNNNVFNIQSTLNTLLEIVVRKRDTEV